ncbi:hypothetical protein [Tepidibacter hydrothermalis]|uniref:Uncharacterized protein n=1 Tax=Tepidibacter hydrothermalis TaxID=3036126 RepID=A0ABY8E7R2_9FIRM|nr:hypothetical protein [Tepidibacter hydrothermalis]WFD08917.1 hypothetical protein P4S50_11010 [Tepidibacter hydrothermalis]
MDSKQEFLGAIRSELDDLVVGALHLEKVYVNEKDAKTNDGIQVEWHGDVLEGHYYVLDSNLYTDKARKKIAAKLDVISSKIHQGAKKGLIQNEQDLWG